MADGAAGQLPRPARLSLTPYSAFVDCMATPRGVRGGTRRLSLMAAPLATPLPSGRRADVLAEADENGSGHTGHIGNTSHASHVHTLRTRGDMLHATSGHASNTGRTDRAGVNGQALQSRTDRAGVNVNGLALADELQSRRLRRQSGRATSQAVYIDQAFAAETERTEDDGDTSSGSEYDNIHGGVVVDEIDETDDASNASGLSAMDSTGERGGGGGGGGGAAADTRRMSAPMLTRGTTARLNYLRNGSARHSPRQRRNKAESVTAAAPGSGSTSRGSSVVTVVSSDGSSRPSTAVVTEDGGKQMIFDIRDAVPVVMAGTTVALIEHLLGYSLQPQPYKSGWNPFQAAAQLKKEKQAADEDFAETFVLAYRAFLQAEPLAQILLNQLSKAAGDAELTRHVLLAVRCWIQLGWSDFRDDPRLMELLWRLLRVAGDDAAAELTAAVNQRIEADAVARQSAADLQASTPPNVSIVVVDAQQLAEQLALYNSRLFRAVGPEELMAMVLTDETRPSVAALMARFDEEYYWVEGIVTECGDPKLQAVMLDKLVHVASHSRSLNNFFSMFTVLGALDTPRTRKLPAWNAVPRETRKLLTKLQDVLSTERNMRAYRQLYRRCAPKMPRLPFLPIVTKDLRFAADGNSAKVDDDLHNFERLRMMAAVVLEVMQHASLPYKRLTEDPALQRYFFHSGADIQRRLSTASTSETAESVELDRDDDEADNADLRARVEQLEATLAARDAELAQLCAKNNELTSAKPGLDTENELLRSQLANAQSQLRTLSEERDVALAQVWALQERNGEASRLDDNDDTVMKALQRLRQLEQLQTAVAKGMAASSSDGISPGVLAAMCERAEVLAWENNALRARLQRLDPDADLAEVEAELRREVEQQKRRRESCV